jgi:hypothetical protein
VATPAPRSNPPRDFESLEERGQALQKLKAHPLLLRICMDGHPIVYCEKHGIVALVTKDGAFSQLLACRTRSVAGVENWRFTIRAENVLPVIDNCWKDPRCRMQGLDDLPTYVLKRLVYEFNWMQEHGEPEII